MCLRRKLAKLPSITTMHTINEGRHGLVTTSSLQLRIGTLLLFTLSTSEHFGFGTLVDRDLMVQQVFLIQLRDQIFQFLTRHFCGSHFGNFFGGTNIFNEAGSELWVFWVLQVGQF